MEIKLINGHNQIIFSENDKKEIIGSYMSGESMRSIQRRYNISAKPLRRLLDENNIDHSRGNLRAYVKNYPDGIYDENIENEIQDKINNLNIRSNHNKYYINRNYFDVIDTEDKAYILGFLYADGNNFPKKSQITMGLEEKDKDILNKMNTCLQYSKELTYQDLSNKHDFGYSYEDMYKLCIYDKHMCNVLDLRGMHPNKSLILEFPKWLHPSLYSHFIRGYFDGDGSLYRRTFKNNTRTSTAVTLTSTMNFCKAVSDICAEYIGINSGIYDASCHNGITSVFSICGNDVCKKFLDWIYKDATIYLERKYKRYVDYYELNNSLSA